MRSLLATEYKRQCIIIRIKLLQVSFVECIRYITKEVLITDIGTWHSTAKMEIMRTMSLPEAVTPAAIPPSCLVQMHLRNGKFKSENLTLIGEKYHTSQQ